MRPLRAALYGFAALGGLLVVGLVALAVLGVAIPVGPLRPGVEEAATRALGEPVTFGALGIIPRVPPTLVAGELAIGESNGGAGDQVLASKLQVRLALLPLLRREIRLAEVSAEEIVVDLVAASSPLLLDRLDAVAPIGEALHLSGSGSWGAESVHFVVDGGPLSDLVSGEGSWPFEGRLEAGALDVLAGGSIDRSRADDCLDLTLRSDAVDAGDLARRATGNPRLQGTLEGVQVLARAPCEQSNELLDALRLELSVAGGNLHLGEPEISAKVERFRASHSSAAGTAASARLSLPKQTLAVELEMLPRETDGPRPFRATLDGAGAHLDASGVLEIERGAGHVEFELGGARAGDLAGWLGVDPDSDALFRAAGSLEFEPEGWGIVLSRVRLGQSTAHAHLSRSADEAPLVGEIAFETLAPAELSELIAQDATGEGAPESEPLHFADADLKLSIARLLGSWSSVSDVEVEFHTRGGKLRGAFGAQVAGIGFRGETRIDETPEALRAALDISARDVDLGKILAELGLARGVVAHADGVTTKWSAEGITPDEFLATSRLEAEIHKATWEIRDPGSEEKAVLHVERGQLRARPGSSTRLDLEGAWDGLPAEFRLETAPLAELAKGSDALDTKLTGRIQQTELELSLRAALPLDRGDLDGAFEARGARFDALEPLLGIGLPPLGPYSVQARLEVGPDSYRLRDAIVRVGETELQGEGTLETASTRPRLDVRLHTAHLQLDDLTLSAEAPSAGTPGDLAFLEVESLESLDATVAIRADRTSLGPEDLGSGTLRVVLEEGRLSIDPGSLRGEAGDATLVAHCEPTGGELQCDAVASVPLVEYGDIARRIDPTADHRGLLSFETDLTSLNTSEEHPLSEASGKIDFLVLPDQLDAGALDTFTVNLFFAALPLLGITRSSVNCLVGEFDLENGVLRADTLLLDTTTTRVLGEGTIDFGRERVDLILRPVGKRARLLSPETQLVLKGHFSDFRFDLPPESLVGSAVHVGTSLITAPLQWLSGKSLPVDGRDVCGEPQSFSAEPGPIPVSVTIR